MSINTKLNIASISLSVITIVVSVVITLGGGWLQTRLKVEELAGKFDAYARTEEKMEKFLKDAKEELKHMQDESSNRIDELRKLDIELKALQVSIAAPPGTEAVVFTRKDSDSLRDVVGSIKSLAGRAEQFDRVIATHAEQLRAVRDMMKALAR
ncbi:MAG: hypothetical protein ACKVZJ_06000 [Phycisphaerales bacterium]